MRKTSVYLTDEEAEGLRRLAVREGKAQAELIREGVRRVIAEVDAQPRTFHSLGLGRGGDAVEHPHWDAEELYRKRTGKR
jgi:hypothetical protein